MALILAAVALVPPIGRTRVAYATALLVAVELSRGLHGLVYPVLYNWLPFMRGLRSPARAGMFVGMTLAILAGFGVRRLLATTSSFRARAILVGLVAAVALDLRPALPLERVWQDPPPIYGSLAGPMSCSPSFRWSETLVPGSPTRYTCTFPYGTGAA
jgi:hypothetical protein